MSESGSRVFELYERALDRPAAERESWLRASGAAAADVDRVLSMLRAEATVAGLNVARGGVELAAAAAEIGDGDPLPTLRGHYRMIRPIGEGGTGTVYEAEQSSPRRRVAVKALRPGVASRRAVARLRAEADILGRLQHPGIAQVFEAGLGDEAQPEQAFIVMELVDGQPIHRHAEAAGLSLRERVRLMLGVCDAVEHAHRRGVIHRDLKPANILVTPDGRPKVLDFGVARLVGDAADDVEDAGIVGTLGYMSPEQAAGRSAEVDVRADVYALGAVLYHLLTGRPPLSLEGLDLAAALAAVRDGRPTPAGRLNRGLRGDLDAVLARAMAPRVEDRYPSVAALAADLRAHLSGRAVLARGDRKLYVAGRFLRRHWVVAAVAGVALVGVVSFAALAASEARRNRVLAEAEREARGAADRSAVSLRAALYRSHVGMARASLLLGDAGAAGRALASCDPADRGWEWGYLAGRLDRSDLRAAAFSGGWLNHAASGGVVAVSHHTEGLILLDAGTGRELARNPSLTSISAIAPLAGSGGTEAGFVAAADGGELLVIDAPTLRVRARHRVTDGLIRAVGVDGAGGRVFVLDQAAGVAVVDVETGARLGDIPLPGRFAFGLAVLDGGERVAIGGDFGVLVARTDSGEVLSRAGGFGRVLAVGADSAGTRIVVGVDDGTMRVFDAATGVELIARRTSGNKINAAAFTPDGASVVGGGTDMTISVMDVSSGATVALLTGHSGSVLRLSFDANGAMWSSARDGSLRRWNTESLLGDAGVRPFSRGFPYRVVPAGEGWLLLSRTGELTRVDRSGHAAKAMATSGVSSSLGLAWDNEGGRAIVVGGSGVASIDSRGSVLWARPANIGSPGAGAVAMDGGLAVVGGDDGVLRWFEPATGRVVREAAVGTGPVRSLAVSGGRVGVGMATGVVAVIGPDGVVGSVRAHGGDSWCVAFSPDGRRLVSAGEDGALVMIDAATLGVVARGLGHSGSVLVAAFSPEGTRIATGGFDNTVRLWDADGVEELMRLPGHTGAVTDAAFSADGLRLATVASDGVMRVHVSDPSAAVDAVGR